MRPWDLFELSSTLTELASQQSRDFNFCFFIDGLDEYEGAHIDIISILNSVALCSNVKICLSSRPWNIFEDAFGQNKNLKLYLQDLTRDDIEAFVKDKLESHKMLVTFTPQEKVEYQSLILEIVSRSQGVFLWVFLVVRSLNEGMINCDSIAMLIVRLRSLPLDLENSFKHIMEQVDEIYQHDMARTLQQLLQTDAPPTLLELSFFDEDDDWALALDIGRLTLHEIDARNQRMRRRIAARCKGLVEVYSKLSLPAETAHTVHFLHRSVRDFLFTKDMQQMLTQKLRSGTIVNRSICRSRLALIKKLPYKRNDTVTIQLRSLYESVQSLLAIAYQAKVEMGATDQPLLLELGTTIDRLSLHLDYSIYYQDGAASSYAELLRSYKLAISDFPETSASTDDNERSGHRCGLRLFPIFKLPRLRR